MVLIVTLTNPFIRVIKWKTTKAQKKYRYPIFVELLSHVHQMLALNMGSPSFLSSATRQTLCESIVAFRVILTIPPYHPLNS